MLQSASLNQPVLSNESQGKNRSNWWGSTLGLTGIHGLQRGPDRHPWTATWAWQASMDCKSNMLTDVPRFQLRTIKNGLPIKSFLKFCLIWTKTKSNKNVNKLSKLIYIMISAHYFTCIVFCKSFFCLFYKCFANSKVLIFNLTRFLF